MSESGSVRRRNLEFRGSGTHIRSSRSEPSISTSDKETSKNRIPKDLFLCQYAAPCNAWFPQCRTPTLQISLKVAASLLALLLFTALFAVILPYTGLPEIKDQLPSTTEFSKHVLQFIQNFSPANIKKKQKLRVYHI